MTLNRRAGGADSSSDVRQAFEIQCLHLEIPHKPIFDTAHHRAHRARFL